MACPTVPRDAHALPYFDCSTDERRQVAQSLTMDAMRALDAAALEREDRRANGPFKPGKVQEMAYTLGECFQPHSPPTSAQTTAANANAAANANGNGNGNVNANATVTTTIATITTTYLRSAPGGKFKGMKIKKPEIVQVR